MGKQEVQPLTPKEAFDLVEANPRAVLIDVRSLAFQAAIVGLEPLVIWIGARVAWSFV